MSATLENLYFELTGACNLLCKHCYIFTSEKKRARPDNLTAGKIDSVVNDAKTLGLQQLTFTGGEIFLRKDLKTILNGLVKYDIPFNLLTNLTLVKNKDVDWLSKLPIGLISTSLDGMQFEHDAFRGKQGSFERTLNVLLSLRSHNIPVKVSVSVHDENLDSAKYLFEYLDGLGISSSIARVAPIGRGTNIHSLNSDIFNEKYTTLLAEKLGSQLRTVKPENLIPPGVSVPTYCGVGESILYVMSDGIVGLCPTLNRSQGERWVVGDLMTAGIIEIWGAVKQRFEQLRCSSAKSCAFGSVCKGGCRANAFANSGDEHGCDKEMFYGFSKWKELKMEKPSVEYKVV